MFLSKWYNTTEHIQCTHGHKLVHMKVISENLEENRYLILLVKTKIDFISNKNNQLDVEFDMIPTSSRIILIAKNMLHDPLNPVHHLSVTG